MSSYTFKCSCKAELTIEGAADEVLKVYEVWQIKHNHHSHNPKDKVEAAIRAQGLLAEGHTLREIAPELGFSHPQSVKYLIERYAPNDHQ
jgi:hypothetical protein